MELVSDSSGPAPPGDAPLFPVLRVSSTLAFPGLAVAVPLVDPDARDLVKNLKTGDIVVQALPALAEAAGQRRHAAPAPPDASDSGEADSQSPKDLGLAPIGVSARVLKQLDSAQATAQVVIEGLDRVTILRITGSGPDTQAAIEPLECPAESVDLIEDLRDGVLRSFDRLADLDDQLPAEVMHLAHIKAADAGRLADYIASTAAFTPVDRRAVVETSCLSDRLQVVTRTLDQRHERLRVQHDVEFQARASLETRQRRRLLREQLKQIHRELGDGTEADLAAAYRRRLERIPLPRAVREVVETSMHRLEALPTASVEFDAVRHHLDAFQTVPWRSVVPAGVSLEAFEKSLQESLVGLRRAKEEIVEFMAVLQLNRNRAHSALAIVGPPGVGRRVIARAVGAGLGRPFVQIDLNSLESAEDLIGSRHTIVGASPGLVVRQLSEAGVMNPVILLNGLDELGDDPSPAMLRAILSLLDPARRTSFVDEFLGVPIDLGGAIVLATAMTPFSIPDAFLDSLEIVTVWSYIDSEKLEIMRRFLVGDQLEAHGLTGRGVSFTDEALLHLITRYTREAGVWELNRALAVLCRKLAYEAAMGRAVPTPVTSSDVERYLGRPRIPSSGASRSDAVGVAMGLAWTPEGGDILPIEAIRLPGGGEVQLTGQLGEVLRESAAAALSFVRSRAPELDIRAEAFNESSLHINLPEGAIPKDGPSAGMTLAVVIASLMTNRPVRHDVAMTGEITLRGRILPVGGVREKVLGAYRAGLRTVILPAENSADLEDVPEAISREMRFVTVETADQALDEALARVAIPSRQERDLFERRAEEPQAAKPVPPKRRSALRKGKRPAASQRSRP